MAVIGQPEREWEIPAPLDIPSEVEENIPDFAPEPEREEIPA